MRYGEDVEQWQKLRSDIYVRDKGMCWICNEFVELKDYDLGHLVDMCNGGKDAYDNLAVMHHWCNISKPRHTTLEECLKWKLTPSYLSRLKPKAIMNPITPTINTNAPARIPQPTLPPVLPRHNYITRSMQFMSREDAESARQLIIEYFKSHPELLANGSGYNRERIIASKQLANTLDITRADVRLCLRESGLVDKRPPQTTNGEQYRYIYEHLDELLAKYESIKDNFLYDQPRLMGVSHYWMDIMFYLSGQVHKVSKRNYQTIAKRVARLGIPIRNI